MAKPKCTQKVDNTGGGGEGAQRRGAPSSLPRSGGERGGSQAERGPRGSDNRWPGSAGTRGSSGPGEKGKARARSTPLGPGKAARPRASPVQAEGATPLVE